MTPVGAAPSQSFAPPEMARRAGAPLRDLQPPSPETRDSPDRKARTRSTGTVGEGEAAPRIRRFTPSAVGMDDEPSPRIRRSARTKAASGEGTADGIAPPLFDGTGRAALDTGAGRPPFLATILFRVQQFAQEFLAGGMGPADTADRGSEAYHRAFRLGHALLGVRPSPDIAVMAPRGPLDIVV